jgi:nicotinate-nucleotide adenylyltransferase
MLRAVLGGSFDPVHNGHLAIVQHMFDKGLADFLVVVPAWRSPHKFENSAPPADRLAMAHLAFDDLEAVQVDDREITRGRVSFTMETLEEMAGEYPADRLRLVIGGDNLAGFSGWRSTARIQELADIIVYPRDGFVATPAAIRRAGLDPGRVIPVTGFDHPVSSTTVRVMLGRGILPEEQLPPEVTDFIAARQLYTA